MEAIEEIDENLSQKSKEEKVDDDNPIEDYLKFVKKCMKSIAMLPLFESDRYKYFNILHMFLVDLMSFQTFVLSLIDLIYSWDGNLFETTMNLINTIIYAINTVMLLYFQVYGSELLFLINYINSTFKYKSSEGLTRLNMRASYEKAMKYSRIFTVSCLIGAMHYAVQPLIIERDRRTLPIKLWYPFDVERTPNYQLAFLFQILGQIMVALVYSNFGVFFMSVCILICGQFDLLNCSLRNLTYTVLIKRRFRVNDLVQLTGYSYVGTNRCTIPEDEWKAYFSGEAEIMDPKLDKCYREDLKSVNDSNSVNKKQINFEFEFEAVSIIRDCVKQHEMILEYCHNFDAFCGPIAFVKMLQITILACVIMYAFSVSFQIPLLEYGVLTCFDLFLPCYFGNEVMLRSLSIQSAIFGGPWQLLGVRPLRYILPMLIKTTRPVRFRGGKFYKLNLENFISVLKVSVSYFTVLRNINDKVEVGKKEF